MTDDSMHGEVEGEAGDDGQAQEARADRLRKLMRRPMTRPELELWETMPTSRQAKALQRASALDKYRSKKLSAKDAAADAGLELGRFYQIARAWSSRPSLKALGSYATVTKERRGQSPEVARELNRAVVRVVKSAKEGDSIDSLARRLAEEVRSNVKKVPGRSTLRQYVEREKRRLRQLELAGNEVQFDCAYSSLTREDGQPWMLFLVMDNGTGLVLGTSIGTSAATMAGYRAASQDALGRILHGLPPSAMWSGDLKNSELVPGMDKELIAERLESIKSELGGAAPQLTKEGAFGQYAKRHLGMKIGPIRLGAKPLSTTGGSGLSEDAARKRMEVAVSAHNVDVLKLAPRDGAEVPPEKLLRLLQLLSEAD